MDEWQKEKTVTYLNWCWTEGNSSFYILKRLYETGIEPQEISPDCTIELLHKRIARMANQKIITLCQGEFSPILYGKWDQKGDRGHTKEELDSFILDGFIAVKALLNLVGKCYFNTLTKDDVLNFDHNLVQ